MSYLLYNGLLAESKRFKASHYSTEVLIYTYNKLNCKCKQKYIQLKLGVERVQACTR